ncbi:MAG: PEP-CTERM system TPR-repeat protein PrsT [Halioglobus sp.]|nr:PEP-CTERM system TPR-repeat protein PrsT [Halioglobus sp.]
MPEIKHSLSGNLLRLALAGCIFAAVACSESTTGTEYMDRAEQHFQAEDYADAIIELKNALGNANEAQETLPRARWMLGKSYLETGNMMAAAKELELARELGWNPNDVLPALAKALLHQGELDKVLALSPAGLDSNADARLRAQQALAQLGQGDIWTADTYIATAVGMNSDDTDVLIAEARMSSASGDVDGALATLNHLLASRPEEREAWSLKGDLLSKQKKLPEALAAFDKSIELSPDRPDDRLKRALIHLHLQQLDAVKPDADFLLEVAPNHPMTHFLQGLLYFHSGNYADSITALATAEPVADRYPLILFYLAGAHLAQGNKAEALRQAEQQVDWNPSFVPGRILLANIYIKSSRATDAQRTLLPVLDADPTDTRALNLMAKALLLDGKTDQALRMLQTLQQIAPDSAVANFNLGAGLVLSGESEAANRQLEAALALDPSLEQADILQVLNLSDAQDHKGAIAAAQDYAERHPQSTQAHSLLGQMYLADEQLDSATAAFNKALALAPGDPAANHGLAEIAQLAGDTAASDARYQAVLAERPNYLPTLLHMALLAAERGDEADVVTQLQFAIEAHPEALEPRLMLARYYLWKNTPAKIPALFASLSELQQQAPEVLRLMAMSQLAEQQYGMALYNLEQLIAMKPDTALAHHLLATAAAGAGETDKAKAGFKRALALDDDFAPTLVSLARLAWVEGDMSVFDTYVEKLQTLAAGAPDVLRLQAAAAQRDNDPVRAIELSRQVLATAPSTTAVLELAGYLYRSDNSEEALQLIQDWVSDHPSDTRARMALADLLMYLEQDALALQEYREVLKLEPKNTAALNNLAWHLRETQPREALEFARRAVTTNPGQPQTLDTLALIESDAGNQQEALRHIKRAVTEAPDNPTLRYHHAMIEARAGNTTAAVGILESILGDDNPAFAEQEEAEQLRRSLQ